MQQAKAVTPPPQSKRLDARVVNAIMTAAVYTFKVQCKYDIQYQKAEALTPALNLKSDVCAMIGMTCDVFSGNITLAFSKELFLGVMESMFDEKFTELTQELTDGAAELLNIIFGGAKTKLTNENIGVAMSLPTVASGNGIKVSSITGGGQTIVVHYSTKHGPFYLLVSLSKLSENA